MVLELTIIKERARIYMHKTFPRNMQFLTYNNCYIIGTQGSQQRAQTVQIKREKYNFKVDYSDYTSNIHHQRQNQSRNLPFSTVMR